MQRIVQAGLRYHDERSVHLQSSRKSDHVKFSDCPEAYLELQRVCTHFVSICLATGHEIETIASYRVKRNRGTRRSSGIETSQECGQCINNHRCQLKSLLIDIIS